MSDQETLAPTPPAPRCCKCGGPVPAAPIHQRLGLCVIHAAEGCLAFCVVCGEDWPEHGPRGQGCATWIQEETEPPEMTLRRLRDSGGLEGVPTHDCTAFGFDATRQELRCVLCGKTPAQGSRL